MTIIYLAILAAICISLYFNFRKGLQMYVVTFPIIQTYMQLGSGSQMSVSTLLWLVVAITIFWKLFTVKNIFNDLKANIHNRAILLFSLLLLVSVIGNLEVLSANIGDYIIFITREVFIVYIGWLSFKSVDNGKKVIVGLMVSFFLLAVYGVIELILQHNYILDYLKTTTNSTSLFVGNQTRGYTVQTIYYHPYSWGGVLLIVSGAYLYAIFNLQGQKKFFIAIIAFLIILLNIITTRGRSSIFPIAFLILGIFLLDSSLRFRKLKLIIPILFAPLLIIIYFPQLWTTIEQYFTLSSNSPGALRGSTVEMRLLQFDTAWDIVKDDFIIGKGFEYTGALLAKIGGDTGLQGAESIWMSTLINTGLLGVIAHIILFFFIIKKIFKLRVRQRSYPLNRQIIFFIMNIVSYLIFISLTGTMHTFHIFMLWIGVISKYLFLQRIQYDRIRKNENIQLNARIQAVKEATL